MSTLEVRIFGDPVLRQRARTVEDFDGRLARLARDMTETMRAHQGVGLAANQVGVLKRIFTWEVESADGERSGGAVVNPVLDNASETMQAGDEGCLSFPGLFYPLERPLEITVTYRDVEGEQRRAELEGHAARIWLHEMDHLDGVLFVDHLAAHDRRAAVDAMRRYRMEHDLDAPDARDSGGLLLGRQH